MWEARPRTALIFLLRRSKAKCTFLHEFELRIDCSGIQCCDSVSIRQIIGAGYLFKRRTRRERRQRSVIRFSIARLNLNRRNRWSWRHWRSWWKWLVAFEYMNRTAVVNVGDRSRWRRRHARLAEWRRRRRRVRTGLRNSHNITVIVADLVKRVAQEATEEQEAM